LLDHPEVEEQSVLRSTFGFMAFHAGLEGGTWEIATRASSAAEASLYAVTQPTDLRWHVPSALVDPASSDVLASYLSHVEVAVAVHGYGRLARPRDLLVGGSNRPLASHIAAALRSHLPEYTVIDDLDAIPVELRGLHPSNPVNRPAGGGVQLELPPAARGASVRLADLGAPCHPPPAVVTALVAAARSWPSAASASPTTPRPTTANPRIAAERPPVQPAEPGCPT
jgi:phage replication-related protein YjqB (UPF0714/DUF867 family)